MANIEKISVGGTSYDVRDASAAHALTDIANAGTNITFTTPTIDDYSIAGTGVAVTNGVASGFSASSYIYKSGSVWNSAVAAKGFVFQIKFNPTSFIYGSNNNYIFYIKSSSNGSVLMALNVENGRLMFNEYGNQAYISSALGTETDYWVRFVVNYSDTTPNTFVVQTSTNGVDFTNQYSSSTYLQTSNQNLNIGCNYNGGYFDGSIDLTETYLKDSDGNILWQPVSLSETPSINATVPSVDQTYNASSANAQSGVAIAGAGFLSNASTGTDSLCVSTITNTLTGFTGFGVASQGANYGVSIGLSSKVGYGAVSLGMQAQSGAGSNYAVCVGWKAQVAASCPYAIQVGTGTNSTANTMSVGLSNNLNVQLLDSSGNIPAARLVNAIQGALTGTTVTLSSANWASNTQTVTVSGMTSSAFVWVSPAPASASDYASSGILCTAQGTNSLTFTCDTAPSSDISVQVVFG